MAGSSDDIRPLAATIERQRALLPSLERAMPRYFFDIHDKISTFDEEGTELTGIEMVKDEALRVLPPIAADEILRGDDQRHFCVLVTDEDGKPIYSATLTYGLVAAALSGSAIHRRRLP